MVLGTYSWASAAALLTPLFASRLARSFGASSGALERQPDCQTNESASDVNRGDYIHSPVRDANHQDRSPNADTLMSRMVIFFKTGRYGLCYTLLEPESFSIFSILRPLYFFVPSFPFCGEARG